jgi:C4-dicarboxylate transporter DctM subunit
MEASVVIVAIAFVALFALLFVGVPIAFGMALVGAAGFAFLQGWPATLKLLGQVLFDTTLSYELSTLPLFILMGNFITRSRMSEELYAASYAFLGHLRGGLAMATVAASAGFSAVCGSSLATAATMTKIAMPEMKRFGYDPGFAAASVAAGGTLGILIPPSVILVLYGVITDNDIGKLFAAGMVPGIIGALLYIVAVSIAVTINPSVGPRGERTSWPERLRVLSRIWGIVLLFVIVLGGIYGGVFTPAEAAGIGAFGAFIFALARRTLTLRSLLEILLETGKTSSMMFMVLLGAIIFANFVNIARFPFWLSDSIRGLNLSVEMVLIALLIIYLILGCLLESLSMMLLTVPVFYPLVTSMGVDPIWFGVFVVVVIELGLITPPVGMNVFVMKATMPEISVRQVFKGLIPFIGVDVVRLLLLILAPGVVLFLPGLMK